MGTIDMSVAVDRVRIAVGDWLDPEILTDEMIQDILDRNDGSEAAAVKQCGSYLLMIFAQSPRQRLDRIELWGSDKFNQYLTALKYVINNPVNSPYATAGIYAAGVSVEDIINNALDTTVFQKPLPVGNGYSEYDSLVSTELKYE